MLRWVPLLIVLLIATYLETGLAWVFPASSFEFLAFFIILLLPILSQLWMVLFYFNSQEDEELFAEDFLRATSYASLGFTSFALGLLALRDLARGILALASHPIPILYSPAASFGIVGLSFFLLFLGYRNARFSLQLPDVSVRLKKLPASFENFKIVQLSDVHFGTGPKLTQVKKIIDQTIALKPDLIALTGDIIDGLVSNMGPELQELGRLKAPHGVFFVMGNHEYYWNGKSALQAIESLGIKILLNESVIIQKGNDRIQLSGMDDLASAHFGGKGAIAPKADPDASVKIMLAHQPQTASKAQAEGYDLQLSGHTHGGQFFPWNYAVKLMYPVPIGLGKIKNMFLYVSQGSGFWGPPIRLGTSCEIATLRLLSDKA